MAIVPMAADLQQPAKLAALSFERPAQLPSRRPGDLRHADAAPRKSTSTWLITTCVCWPAPAGRIAKVVRVVSGDYLHSILKTGCTIFEGRRAFCSMRTRLFPARHRGPATLANAGQLLGGSRHLWAGSADRHPVQLYDPHGAGPLPTEMPEPPVMEAHNKDHRLGGRLRAGPLDMVALDMPWKWGPWTSWR